MVFASTISVSQLARSTRDVIARLVENAQDRLVVMRNNRPVAVIGGVDAGQPAAPPGQQGKRPSLKEEVLGKADAFRTIAMAHGATAARLFGSVARGEERKDSDIDFVVELEPGRSLLDVAALQRDLAQLFDRAVDVVPEKSLKPRLKAAVRRQSFRIF